MLLLPLMAWPQALANEEFIEGFPDVPKLDIVTSIENEPVIFDTSSGTVAEVSLRLSATVQEALSQYSAALKGLGWACKKSSANIRCTRGDSLVSLTESGKGSEQNNASNLFILRLEPRR